MTSFDTPQNRVTRGIPELASVSDGAEIRYVLTDLRPDATLPGHRRRAAGDQLLRQ
jgi:hypothetical protein